MGNSIQSIFTYLRTLSCLIRYFFPIFTFSSLSLTWFIPSFQFQIIDFSISWEQIRFQLKWLAISIELDKLCISFSAYDIFTRLLLQDGQNQTQKSPKNKSTPSRNWVINFLPTIQIACNEFNVNCVLSSETSLKATGKQISFLLHKNQTIISINQTFIDGYETPSISSRFLDITDLKITLPRSLQLHSSIDVSVQSCLIVLDFTLLNMIRDIFLLFSMFHENELYTSTNVTNPTLTSLKQIFSDQNVTNNADCVHENNLNLIQPTSLPTQFECSCHLDFIQISCKYFGTMCENLSSRTQRTSKPSVCRQNLHDSKRLQNCVLLGLRNIAAKVNNKINVDGIFQQSSSIHITSIENDLMNDTLFMGNMSENPDLSFNYQKLFLSQTNSTIRVSVECTGLSLQLPLEMMCSILFLYNHLQPFLLPLSTKTNKEIPPDNLDTPSNSPNTTSTTNTEVSLLFNSLNIQITLPPDDHNSVSLQDPAQFSVELRQIKYRQGIENECNMRYFSIEEINVVALILRSGHSRTRHLIVAVENGFQYSQHCPLKGNKTHSIHQNTFLQHQEQITTMNFDYWQNWVDAYENLFDTNQKSIKTLLVSEISLHLSKEKISMLCSLTTTLQHLFERSGITFDSYRSFVIELSNRLLNCHTLTIIVEGINLTLSDSKSTLPLKKQICIEICIPKFNLQLKSVENLFYLTHLTFIEKMPLISLHVEDSLPLQLLTMTCHDSNCPILTSITRPLFCCIPHSTNLEMPSKSLVFLSTTSLLRIENINLHLDTLPCSLLGDTLSSWKNQRTRTMNWIQFYFPQLKMVYPKIQQIPFTSCSSQNIPSFSIQSLTIGSINLQLSYEMKPVGIIVCSGINVNKLNLLLSKQLQYSGHLDDLSIFELTEEDSLYPQIFMKVKDPDEISLQPILKFHLSKESAFPPLLEIIGHNIRLIYLQRAVMTIISYFRDIIPAQFIKNSNSQSSIIMVPPLLYPTLTTSDDGNSDPIMNIFSQLCPLTSSINKNIGIFRFSCTLINSEVHLPVNSCGNDAIVFLFRSLTMYRITSMLENSTSLYHLGLYCGEKIWISDELLICDLVNDSHLTTLPKWNLQQYSNKLRPQSQQFINLNGNDNGNEFETHLSINLSDCLISSWCCDNLISKSQSIHCQLTIQGVRPWYFGIYNSVFDGLQYISHPIMNFFLVDLTIESIDWVLSRGQYMTIVYMTQQNFHEFMKIIPPLLAPSPQKINLHKKIHGEWCIDDRFPLFLAVPLDVSLGKIHLIENNESYYKLIFTAHESHSSRLKNTSAQSRRAEIINFTSNWVLHQNQNALESNCDFSVPRWSHHHHFRSLFLSHLTHVSHFLIPRISSDPDDSFIETSTKFESLAFIFFSNLHFNIVRRHQGGGMSLEVLAHRFILTKGSQMTSYDYNNEDGEEEGIYRESIEGQVGHDIDDETGPVDSNKMSQSNLEPIDDIDLARRRSQSTASMAAIDPIDILFDFDIIPTEMIILTQNKNGANYPNQHLSQEQDQCQEGQEEDYTIFYSQNGVGNLRRCFIDIAEVILATHLLEITKLINFFVECITLADIREKSYITAITSRKYNYRALLDVELYVRRLFLCVPSNLIDPHSDSKGVCMEIDSFEYRHSWRGFLEQGPGWIEFLIHIDLRSLFISTIWEIFNEDQSENIIQSLITPLDIEYRSSYAVYPTSQTINMNSSVLNNHEQFYPIITPQTVGFFGDQPRLDDLIHIVHRMALIIKPNSRQFHPSQSQEINKNNSQSEFQITLSFLDVSFILKLISTLKNSFNNRKKRSDVYETYPIFFSSYQDIHHLPRLTHILSFVECGDSKTTSTPTSTPTPTMTKEFHLNTSNVSALFKNNSYGLKILRLNLLEPNFSYVTTKSGINAAISGCLNLNIYNQKINYFDPIVESLKFIVVCATDISSTISSTSVNNNNTNNEVSPNQNNQKSASKLRFDVSFEPIEINLAFNTLSSLIHHLSLGDIVTSRSSKLPVYRVVNLLGVPINCKFYLQNSTNSSTGNFNQISLSTTLDVNQTFALDTHLHENCIETTCDSDVEGHCLHVSYKLNSIEYVAIKPYQMDSEGIYEIILNPRRVNDYSDLEYDEAKLIYAHSCGGGGSGSGSGGHNTKHAVKILLSMRVVDAEGTRELILKSIFSIKNETICPVSLICHLNVLTVEKQLKPQEVWSLPVTIISQFTNIWMVLQPEHQKNRLSLSGGNDDINSSVAMEYVNMFPSLYWYLYGNDQSKMDWVNSITAGFTSIRMKSQLLTLRHNMSYDNSKKDSTEWSNFILPVPLEISSSSTSSSSSPSSSSSNQDNTKNDKFVIKFPQDHFKNASTDQNNLNISTRETSWKDIHALETQSLSVPALYPCQFSILPPLELINLFCLPLLYRICEKGNPLNCAEGCILPGRPFHIHCNPLKSLCISTRLLNYRWSAWVDIPIFPTSAKVIEETMESLSLSYNSHDLKLPILTFSIKSFERFIYLYCPLWIINRTGKTLCLREGGFTLGNENDDKQSLLSENCFIPSRGQYGIENCLVSQTKSNNNLNENNQSGNNSSNNLNTLAPPSSSSPASSSSSSSNLASKVGRTQSLRRSMHSSSSRLSTVSISFTIISPFDHCKTVSITCMASSLTIKSFISMVLEKMNQPETKNNNDNDNTTSQSQEFNDLRVDLNPSEYQLFFYDGTISDTTFATSKILFRDSFTREEPSMKPSQHQSFLDFQSNIGLNISQLILSPSFPHENSLVSSIPHDKRDKLILFSNYEIQIIQQIHHFTRKEKRKSSLANLIGMKSVQYVTPFIHYKGEIPYHPKGMILTPSFSFCIQNETDWSDSISIQSKSNGKLTKNIQNEMNYVKLMKNSIQVYEYSLSYHQGKGIYSDMTIVTIIPRLILQSKLPFALQIRQVVIDESSSDSSSHQSDIKAVSEDDMMLLPYSLQQYHHKIVSTTPLLQFRQYSASCMEGNINNEDLEETLSLSWSGEVNITTIGLYHIFLRNPDKILNIRVESVGVSLIVILSLQNPKWPPYRIENKTSFLLRFRQSWKKNKKNYNTFSTLQPFSTQPYAWDQPFNYCNEKLILSMEFLQIGNHWISTEFPLNEIDFLKTMKLHQLLPDLAHPICSGELHITYDRGNTNFMNTFAAISEDIIFLFKDSSLSNFLGLINLSLPLPPSEQRVGMDRSLAFLAPYAIKSSSLESVLAAVGLGNRESRSDVIANFYEKIHFWDINSIRRVILKIGSYFNLFGHGNCLKQEMTTEILDIPNVPNVPNDPNDLTAAAATANSASTASPDSPSDTIDLLTPLKASLKAGLRVDELNTCISAHPFLITDLLSALVILGEASNELSAIYLVKEMYRRHYLQVYSGNHMGIDPQQRIALSAIDFQTDILYLHPPTLCPEFESNRPQFGDSLNTPLTYELISSTKHYLFQFSDESDQLKWLCAIRMCIEKSWIKSLLLSNDDKHVSIKSDQMIGHESYETTVCLKMYTDGPIKVLEITEDSPQSIVEIDENSEGVDIDEVTVSMYLPSLGFSIIDNSPTELLYIFFRDIQLILDSSPIQRIYIFTVEYIQIDNQLLNPLYPVAFHPRKTRIDKIHDTNERKMILLLPGLEHSRRQTLNPTLHCYIQQKLVFEGSTLNHLHNSSSSSSSPSTETGVGGAGGTGTGATTTTTTGTATATACDLLYFDHLSFWIAPLELSIDEEIIVRTLRIFTKLSSQYVQQMVHRSTSLSSTESQTIITYASFQQLRLGGIAAYLNFSNVNLMTQQNTLNIYIKLLEIHPIDLILTVRSTPDFELYEAEDLFLTKMIRVDYGNIQLNALIVKNMFGLLSFLLNILTSHYKISLLRQVYSLIGATDVIEGSVGLLTNLGSGVYDLFYEPIEGLLGDEHTFMEGLSKGGKSLASKAIGGTSAFTSKITGGIGLGMAMLTFDSKYQKNREKERLKAAQSVTEGIYVGSKELGKNIYEGVAGIVVEPYRGWVEEGGIGFGLGLARGLIGVAIKPAVGVFDLASRTTEGIKHSAFNNFLEANTLTISGRIRFPRQFGSKGELFVYNWTLPSLQIILDRLTNPIRVRNFSIVAYLPIIRTRSVNGGNSQSMNHDHNRDSEGNENEDENENQSNSHSEGYGEGDEEYNREPILNREPLDDTTLAFQQQVSAVSNDDLNQEIHGYSLPNQYYAVVCKNSILLLHVDEILRKPKYRWEKIHLMWKCPCNAIEQFQSHPNGDIILILKPISATDSHHSILFNESLDSPYPTLHDIQLVDYYIFQEILERLFQSYELARLHPLIPSKDVSTCVQLYRKRTGLKSFMKNSTKHEYRLFKYVLYEFTEFNMEDVMKERRVVGSGSGTDEKGISECNGQLYQEDSTLGDLIQTVNGNEVIFSSQTKIGQFISNSFQSNLAMSSIDQQDKDRHLQNDLLDISENQDNENENEVSIEQIIPDIYDRESEEESADDETRSEESTNDGMTMILTAAIPLIDIRIQGPDHESTNSKGEKSYSITLKRKNSPQGSSSSMLADSHLSFIKRDDMNTSQQLQTNRLKLSTRESVKLLFSDQITAQNWKIYLSESSLSSRSTAVLLPSPSPASISTSSLSSSTTTSAASSAPSAPLRVSSSSSGVELSASSAMESCSSSHLVYISSLTRQITEVGNGITSGAEYRHLPNGRQLIIPCGGGRIEENEQFKIEIAKIILQQEGGSGNLK